MSCRNILMGMVFSVVLMFASHSLIAENLVWAGGSTGAFADSSNWSPARSPAPGDTLTFNTPVEISESSFDIGAKGLNIIRNANVTSRVSFTGSGRLTLSGSGKWTVSAACTHSGGTVVNDGDIAVKVGGSYVNALGTGLMEINANTNAKGPCIEIGVGSGSLVAAPVRFNGKNNNAIIVQNPSRFSGAITANAEIAIAVSWGSCTFNGPFYASGIPIMLSPKVETSSIVFNGEVDADLHTRSDSKGVVKVGGVSQSDNNSIEVKYGRLEFAAGAAWAGRELLVGGNGQVVFKGMRNLTSQDASVKIESEGKIEGACGFVILPHLFYGEEELSAGVYDAESLPGKISGCVPFVVGGSFWTGGAEGLWSSDGNWSGGNVAKGGNVAIFTNDATIVAEQFDFGTGGVVIANVSDIVLKTSFSGEGSLRKLGEGRVNILANSDYSGGTQLEGGVISLNDSKLKSVFGSGNLLVRGGNQFALPSLELGSWGTTISVPVVFSGEFSANHKVVNLTNHAAFNADVSSASDIMLWSGYGPYTIIGNIAASGQTVAIRTPLETKDGVDRGFTSLLNGSIDASLLKKGPGRLALAGNSPVENNMITIEEGTLILEEQSFWGGSVSVLQKGVLRIQGKGNMSRNAVLTVETGGTVEVADGMRADVASFIVEGRELPPGTYSKANLPGCMTGVGRVRVYRQTFSIIFR